jgi:hypothetical protein
MADLKKNTPLLSQNELDSLSAWRAPQAAQADRWFKYRMVFLLAVVMGYAAKLLLFPDIAAGNYDIAARGEGEMARYFHQRGWFLVVGTCVYLYAYLRDWHFEKVAIGFFSAALMTLVMDYFNVYQFMKDAPTQAMTALIGLRLLGIYCLFLNAAHARRAPPMPRRLWS